MKILKLLILTAVLFTTSAISGQDFNVRIEISPCGDICRLLRLCSLQGNPDQIRTGG